MSTKILWEIKDWTTRWNAASLFFLCMIFFLVLFIIIMNELCLYTNPSSRAPLFFLCHHLEHNTFDLVWLTHIHRLIQIGYEKTNISHTNCIFSLSPHSKNSVSFSHTHTPHPNVFFSPPTVNQIEKKEIIIALDMIYTIYILSSPPIYICVMCTFIEDGVSVYCPPSIFLLFILSRRL